MQSIGGDPWILVDDDWKRMHASVLPQGTTLADDQGFYYTGYRSYAFGGPFLRKLDVQVHEGFKTQKGMESDE